MLKEMLIGLFAVLLLTILPIVAYCSEDGTKAWTIYVAVTPDYMYCRKSNSEYIDITKYKFPLYIGYVYMDGSGLIKYKCLIPGAEKNMARWVDCKNRTAGKIVSTYGGPAWYRKAKLGDKNYVEIAANDISREHLVAIKVTPDRLPDDSWVPQFKYQYAVDFLNAKKINTECTLSIYPTEVYRQLDDIIKDYSEAFTIIN